jgi:IS1 family transposase/transposase-like protein
MVYELLLCPHCRSKNVKKNGTTKNQKQNYRCNDCTKQFIRDYTYTGCKTSVKEFIVPMTLKGSGIRDIASVLHISPNTVLKTLRTQARAHGQHSTAIVTSTQAQHIKVLEIDELWSFVGNKARQRWLWYAVDRTRKTIVAFVIGQRTDASCRKLVRQLSDYQIDRVYTDGWSSYAKYLDPRTHTISKRETQHIERENLNFRTHLKRLHRKTICFSRADDMHYAVIKLYITYTNSS